MPELAPGPACQRGIRVKVRLGISTCPNDTFAFHAILNGIVTSPRIDFDISLLDIQELNEQMRSQRLHVGKASFFAALQLASSYGILSVGSAIGFGVGPLLLAREQNVVPAPHHRVLCPGSETTATLLLHCLYPQLRQVQQRNFAEIMPALAAGQADLGVVIHEGRFTYAQSGLCLVEDLGQRWEDETKTPVALGGLLARHDLAAEVRTEVRELIGKSLAYAHQHRRSALATMRRHAKELNDDVIWAHVDLYVNEQTTTLDQTGRAAILEMHRRAIAAKSLNPALPPPVFL